MTADGFFPFLADLFKLKKKSNTIIKVCFVKRVTSSFLTRQVPMRESMSGYSLLTLLEILLIHST